MLLKPRIRILKIRIPQRRAHDFIPDVRVHDRQPASVGGIGAVFARQPVAQLDEAGGGGVVPEEAPEAVAGRGVAFADALG